MDQQRGFRYRKEQGMLVDDGIVYDLDHHIWGQGGDEDRGVR